MTLTLEPRRATMPLQDINLAHMKRMTTDIGFWQHCQADQPHQRHGYSIDDVARALIVSLGLWQREIDPSYAARLGATCLDFIENASVSDGRYHNFADKNGKWLDPLGSDDSFGRTLWALAVAARDDAPFAPRERALRLIDQSLPVITSLQPLRSKAFCLYALSFIPGYADDVAETLIDDLVTAYDRTAGDDWRWFEDFMTYCNPRIPHALFAGSSLCKDSCRCIDIATASLDFLLKTTRHDAFCGYAPIGNDGWFRRGRQRPPLYDQQPVDMGGLVEACSAAYRVTGESRFEDAAYDAFAWYHGRNTQGVAVYRPSNGGVCDAVTPYGVNMNQGAESVLSYLLAAIALDEMTKR